MPPKSRKTAVPAVGTDPVDVPATEIFKQIKEPVLPQLTDIRFAYNVKPDPDTIPVFAWGFTRAVSPQDRAEGTIHPYLVLQYQEIIAEGIRNESGNLVGFADLADADVLSEVKKSTDVSVQVVGKLHQLSASEGHYFHAAVIAHPRTVKQVRSQFNDKEQVITEVPFAALDGVQAEGNARKAFELKTDVFTVHPVNKKAVEVETLAVIKLDADR